MKYKDNLIILLTPLSIKILIGGLTFKNKIDIQYTSGISCNCIDRKGIINENNIKQNLVNLLNNLPNNIMLDNYNIIVLFKDFKTKHTEKIITQILENNIVDNDIIENTKTKLEISKSKYNSGTFYTYSIDGRILQNPVGKTGKNLGLKASYFSYDKKLFDKILRITENNNIKVQAIDSLYTQHFTHIFKSNTFLSRLILIDFGSKQTEVLILKHHKIESKFTIPFGGFHITNDILNAFNIDFEMAEKLKTQYGSAIEIKSNAKSISVFGKKVSKKFITVDALNTVINARIGEICDFISDSLDDYNTPADFNGGMYIVGGASRLRYLPNLLRYKFGLNVFNYGELIKSNIIYNQQNKVKAKYEMMISYLISTIYQNYISINKSIFSKSKIRKWLQLKMDDFFQ